MMQLGAKFDVGEMPIVVGVRYSTEYVSTERSLSAIAAASAFYGGDSFHGIILGLEDAPSCWSSITPN